MSKFAYQDEVGIPFLRSHARSLLGDEPGLGKSRQEAMAAEAPVLVVAPASVLDGGTWTDEMAKWRPDLELGRDWFQTSYSSVPATQRTEKGGNAMLDVPRPELRREWGTIILDESHHIKGRKTHWTKAIGVLAKEAGRVGMATGTPIPNWAHEIFTTSQMLFPDDAKAGGRLGSYWRWAAEYFQVGATRFSMMAVGDPLEDTDEFWARFRADNLGDRYLARTWDDVGLDVEPFREQQVLCPMTPAQRKAYQDLKKEYVAYVKETGAEVIAWNSGALHVMLAKCCTALELLDPSVKKGSGKMVQLRELVGGTDRQQFVVGHFRGTVELAAAIAADEGRRAVFVHGGTSRGDFRAAVADFKAGRLDVLVSTIDKVAEGLNFEHVDTVVRIERSYRPSRNRQVESRIRRVSSTRPKLKIDLVTPDSVDFGMLAVLASKTDQQIRALKGCAYVELL